jgi:hypothetical protein
MFPPLLRVRHTCLATRVFSHSIRERAAKTFVLIVAVCAWAVKPQGQDWGCRVLVIRRPIALASALCIAAARNFGERNTLSRRKKSAIGALGDIGPRLIVRQ